MLNPTDTTKPVAPINRKKKRSRRQPTNAKLFDHHSLVKSSEVSPTLVEFYSNKADGVNSKDAVFTITDYFEYQREQGTDPNPDKGILNYTLSNQQNLLTPGYLGGYGLGQLRVDSVTVHAFQKSVNGGNIDNIFTVAALVPAFVGAGKGSNLDQSTVTLNHTSTTVNPSFDPQWKKVLHYSADKLFGNSEATPFQDEDNQTLFQLTCFSPMSNAFPLTTFKVPIKVTIVCRQPVPVATQLVRSATAGSYQVSFGEVVATSNTTNGAFVQLDRVKDAV